MDYAVVQKIFGAVVLVSFCHLSKQNSLAYMKKRKSIKMIINTIQTV